MSANFQHGFTFTPGIVFTPQEFNQLVDLAHLNNVENATLASGVRLPCVQDPAGPITGEVRVGSNYLLEFYYGGSWHTQSADPLYETMTNNSGVNLLTGNVVCQDPANLGGFIIPTIKNDPTTAKIAGVLLDDIAAGNSGRVAYRGKVVVLGGLQFLVPWITTGQLLSLIDNWNGGAGSNYNQGVATSATATANAIGNGAIAAYDDSVFGIALGDYGEGGTGALHAYIWK